VLTTNGKGNGKFQFKVDDVGAATGLWVIAEAADFPSRCNTVAASLP
jgi:hypothetical protein